ncbi:MAG: S9 family peptidase [Erysipelotrichaceae bacterium]|nr:S9 family peptidase [Erysipelotrichaceae bacterium]
MEKILIDDFIKFKSLSNPTFSPSGRNFCFTVSQADRENNNYKSRIYMRRNDEFVQLTSPGKESSFFFLDDDTVVFASDREDSKASGSRFYRISLNGGEATLFREFPIPVSKLIPLKDGRFLALGAYDPAFPDLYKGEEKYLEDHKKHLKDNEDYEQITEVPFWFNGDTFTRAARTAVYLADDRGLSLISEPDMDVSFIKLSKDESFALFSASRDRKYRRMNSFDLYHLNLDDLNIRKLVAHDQVLINNVEFADSFIYATGNCQHYGLNTDDDFYRLSYGDFHLEKIDDYGQSLWPSICTDVTLGSGTTLKAEKDTLYFVSTIFDNSVLRKLENGVVSDVISEKGSVDCFDIHDGKIIYVGMHDMKGQELYDENVHQLTRFNQEVLKDRYVAEPLELNFLSGSDDIHGFVYRPFNFDENRKYPVILDIHGGPKAAYGPVFFHEIQYWASEGYFVICCNPTGSDGRGSRFADIRGKYGTIDYADIMNFVDAALKAWPQMDEENLFETGGSYGGFMTNWIIGHTDRFRACASQRSISNWFSFYGISDIGPGFTEDQQACGPFDDAEKLWWHSPMKYADQVKTPTLFIHSDQDYRCPMAEGMQMYTSLITHGIEARLVYFRGENHELSRSGKPLHRIKRLQEITGWFNQHLDKKYRKDKSPVE